MSTVERLEWGILPPDEIRAMSVCNITNDFNSRMKYGDAANDSLCDRRMGPLTSTETCLTCKRTGIECPGHFGRIELATEVIGDHFMQAIRRAMKSICTATPNCPGITVDAPCVDNRAKAEAEANAQTTGDGSDAPPRSKNRCPACKKRLPKIRTGEDGVSFVLTWSDRSREDAFDATAVRELFLLKPDETWRKLGYDPVRAHPASMVMTVLPVLPTNARPYCPTAKGWNASDITSSYGKIVHANEDLKSKIENGRPNMIIEQAKSKLRHAVRVLYDSRKMVGKNGRPITTTQRTTGLNQRIGGKNGRLRLNCMGGRVDFTGRTVITADPLLRVNEIGLPEEFAKTLTIPEAVNDFNIADMRRLVREGKIKLIKKSDGSEVHVEKCQEIKTKVPVERIARTLAKGDVVHRPLRNGDTVLLNRQPSLHKASIMAFYVRLMPGLTIRFNMSCCTPFNADFDGDEMNIHVPQTLQARVEAELLMSVQSNIVSPQNNRPIMALIYDALLGAREMSLRTVFLDERLMTDVMSAVDDGVTALPFPTVFARRKDAPEGSRWGDAWDVRWTGKAALSTVIPESFTYGRWREDDGRRNEFGEAIKSSGFAHFTNGEDDVAVPAEERERHRMMLLMDDKLVRIRHGEFLTGELSKATMGTRTGGLVHTIFNDVGPEACADFLSNIQFLINKWLETRGYSISITHGFIPDRKDRVDKIRETIGTIRPDMTEDDKMAILNGARDAAGKNLNVSDSNPFISMIVAGSKGDVINFTQTSVCLGQQSLYGKRIPMTLNDGTRGLPHFACGSDLPITRGFVESSFTKGLNAFEYWYHAAGGRQGIIDTAIKTADSGYISRQFVKRLENVTVAQDGTARKTNNELVSFNYGDDGFGGAAFMPVSFRSVYSKDAKRFVHVTDPEEARALLVAARTLDDYERRFVDRAEKDPLILLPFTFASLELASEKFQRMLNNCPPMTPSEDGRWVFETVKKTLETCRVEFEPRGGETSADETWMDAGNPLINALFIWNYNSSTILSKNWSRMRLLSFCEDFHTAYRKAKAESYEAIGAIGAQSMGEPATQMTLNSVDYEEALILDSRSAGILPSSASSIGAYIDALLEAFPQNIEMQPDGETAYLPLKQGTARALTVDEYGIVSWKGVAAVTRHPPKNKDGTNTLLRVTTQSGRTVVATKAKSFLVIRNEKVVDVNGSELSVGDQVPVVRMYRPDEARDKLEVSDVLSPKEFLFTDNMIKAREASERAAAIHSRAPFFHEIEHLVPYNRSDSLRVAFKKAINGDGINGLMFVPGRVYPLNWSVVGEEKRVNSIPSSIVLDRSFGFLVGAYLAEGCTTRFQICISNNAPTYRAAATEWARSQGIGTRETTSTSRFGTGYGVCIHSAVLRNLLVKTCGSGAYDKFVPAFAYSAPDEFVRGLIDAYICGDGSTGLDGAITTVSRSKRLRDGMATMLSRFGVFSTLSESMCLNKRDRNDATGEMKPLYHTRVNTSEAIKLQGTLTAIDYKNDRLKEPVKRTREMTILNDVISEPIISIEEIPSSHEFVYDLTVDDTRNMMAINGLAIRDSFHFAGLSTMNVSSGMPRLKELVHATTEDATPIMVFTTTDTAAVLAATKNIHLEHCVVGRPRLALKNAPEDATPSWEHRYRACFTRKRGSAPIPKTIKRKKLAAIDDEELEDAEDAHLDNPVLAKEAAERRAKRRAGEEAAARELELTVHDTDDTYHITMELDERVLRRSKLSLEAVCETIERAYPDFECIHSHESMRTGEPVRFERPFIKVTTDLPASQYVKAKLASKKMLNLTLSGLASTEFETQRVSDTQISVRCKTAKALTKVQSKRKCKLNPIVESWQLEDAGIDHTKTYSNSVHVVCSALGVEAARTVLERELSKVLKYGGSYVNSRHLKLLCDAMCCEGLPVSIKSKKVFEGREFSTLGTSSYEKSIPSVTQGAITATVDELHDTSARIAVGARIEVGTSSKIKILMDEEMYARLSTHGSLLTNKAVVAEEEEEDTEEWQGFIHAEQRAWREKIPVFDSGDGGPSYAFASDDDDESSREPKYVPSDDEDDEPIYVPSDDEGPVYVPSDAVPVVAPVYSPSSPTYTPTSPAASPDHSPVQAEAPEYSPNSPSYSPTSPSYSPSKRRFTPHKFTPRGSPFYSPPPPVVQLGYDDEDADDDDDPILSNTKKRKAGPDPFAGMFNRKRVK